MGTSIDVSSTNFDQAVVQASYDRPVMIDFYATWCGPCQMLKPTLERLVKEYDFVLAKVDIDQNPDLANTYHVEGVPDVRIVTNGQMQPGFVGVLPEVQLRELLLNLNLKSEFDLGLEQAEQAVAQGDVDTAKQRFAHLIEKYPQQRKLTIAAAKFLISQNSLDSAKKLVNSIGMGEKAYYPQAQALKQLIALKQESETVQLNSDLDRTFFDGVKSLLKNDYEAALQTFLDLVGRDRKYRNDGARKAMVMVFDLLGDDHPLTKQYRKQLMSTLY